MVYVPHKNKKSHDSIYRTKNRAKIRESLKAWQNKNKDYVDRRVKNNPKLFTSYLLSNIKHNEKRRVGSNITLEYLCDLYIAQRGRCVLTGYVMTHRRQAEFFDTNISLDRIDNSRGYQVGNVRLVCRRINAMRSDGTDRILYDWCHAVIFGPEECWAQPPDE